MSIQHPAANSALTAIAPAVWGSTYLVTTEFLPPDRPLLASTLRALPAGLILLAMTRVLPRGDWWWRASVLGVLNIGAFFYFLFLAAYHLPGGVAGLLIAVQPMIVLFLGPLLLGGSIQPVHIASCALGTAGVAMLVLQPDAGVNTTGVLAGLAGALCMALGIMLTKRWGRPEGVTLLTFTGWQLTAGGLALVPVALLGEGLPDRLTWTNVGGFAYLSIIGALIAYLLWFRGIARLPAVAVSFLGLASPLGATVLGYVFLDETLSPMQLLGAVAVLVAVIVAQPRAKKRARQQTASEPVRAPSQLQPERTPST